MIIVWDEPKRLENVRKHGLDFADLDPGFFASAQVKASRLGRGIAVAERAGTMITVVFRPLGDEAVSIISMRPSSRRERSGL